MHSKSLTRSNESRTESISFLKMKQTYKSYEATSAMLLNTNPFWMNIKVCTTPSPLSIFWQLNYLGSIAILQHTRTTLIESLHPRDIDEVQIKLKPRLLLKARKLFLHNF